MTADPPAHAFADPAAAAAAPLFPDVTRDDVFRLETRRLWLRWMKLADAPALHGYASLPEVAGMTGTWPHPLPAGECERRIFEARKVNATGLSLVLGITPRDRPNRLIGTIGLSRHGGGAPDLGFMLHPEAWGQGLMTEAARALVDAAFAYSAVSEITAWARVVNPASRRVLEKCGFRLLGQALLHLPARGGAHPCDQFALDRGDWAAMRPWPASGPATMGAPVAAGPSVAVACA